jgi:UDP-glucose 4-epimerase
MSDAILVLGAGGFIGRHLAERPAASGNDVIAATRRPATFAHPRICNAVAAYEDVGHFRRWVPQCRAVVHAASSSTPGSSAAQPQLDGNLRTTLALIEALQDTPSCRLLFLSSGGTLYGDRTEAAREHDPLRPRSYHGAGKAAAEHFIHAWASQYEGTAVVLRPSNVYGPGQPARHRFGITPTAFDCAWHDRPLTIWGDGGTVRDYLFVDDFITLCAMALATPLDDGAHAFNAASGTAVSLNTLIDAVDAVTGRPLQLMYEPARLFDVRSITADTTAARTSFGWQTGTDLATGLQHTWHWYSTQV